MIFFKYTKYIKKTDRKKIRTSAINAPTIRAKGIKLATNVKKNKLLKSNFFFNIVFWNMSILSTFEIAKIKKIQNNIIILIILLSWAHQWLSIGSFINTSYKDFSLNSILAYRNQSISIFAINLVIFFFTKEKNIKNNIFFYFSLIPIAYLLGLGNLFIDTPSGKYIIFLWHFTFVLQMINTLMILNNFSKIDAMDEALLLKINLILIFIYTVVIFVAGNLYFKTKYQLNFLDFNISTNVNGISRMLVILNIFITCNYFIKSKKKKVTLLILLFIINFLIINMESRQGIVLLSVQLFFIIFYYSQKKKLKKTIFKYFLLLIIIPLCLSFIFKNNLKNNRLFFFQGELKHYNFNKDNLIKDNLIKDNLIKDNLIKDNLDNVLTGRLDKWKIVSIHVINSKIKNILFGNGPEFDRKIIHKEGNDAANGLIYLLLCGGLFGLFSFFIIIKKHLKITLNAFCNKKNLNNDLYLSFSICCIISLSLRSLVENGFFVYGVDFLLVTSGFFYTVKRLKLF